jgi:hypothetical protein
MDDEQDRPRAAAAAAPPRPPMRAVWLAGPIAVGQVRRQGGRPDAHAPPTSTTTTDWCCPPRPCLHTLPTGNEVKSKRARDSGERRCARLLHLYLDQQGGPVCAEVLHGLAAPRYRLFSTGDDVVVPIFPTTVLHQETVHLLP